MGNLVIAKPDLSDAATLDGSASVNTSFAISNLQEIAISEKYRVSGTTAYIKVDLGSTQNFNFVGLLGMNVGSASTFRIRAGDSEAEVDGVSADYDPYPSQTTLWPQTGLADWDYVHLIHWITSGTPLTDGERWLRIDITDTGASYIEAGRLYVANAWQLNTNMSWGVGHRWINPSTNVKSLGGQIWIEEQPSFREFSATLEWLTRTEAYVNMSDLQRLKANRKDVFIIQDPNASELMELSMYGRIRTAHMIQRPRHGIYSTRLEVEEMI